MYLAAKKPEKATILEIANRLDLSQAHLMRIAAELAKKGLVVSSCGRGGGVSLAKHPKEITVAAVVRAIEPDFALVQCLGTGVKICSLHPSCKLKRVFSKAISAFFAELEAVTLDDLVTADDHALSAILGLSPSTLRQTTLPLIST